MYKAVSFLTVLLIILVSIPYQCLADYNKSFDRLFFGRQPSARGEALGRGLVAVGADVYSVFYNPAGLGGIKGLAIAGALAGPYYSYENAQYDYFSLSLKAGSKGAIAFSRYHFNDGEPISILVETNHPTYQSGSTTVKQDDYQYILSFATEVLNKLFIGINLDIIQQKVTEKRINNNRIITDTHKKEDNLAFDIGLIKTFTLQKNNDIEHQFNVGFSLFNALNLPDWGYEHLPVIFRFGAAYYFSLNKNFLTHYSKTAELLLHIEYQNLFNYQYRTAYRIGAEFSLLEIMALRLGYFRENQNDFGFPEVNKPILSDITYGFGIQIPLKNFTDRQIPLTAKFDFTNQKQPSSNNIFDDWENFSVYNLTVAWEF